MKGRVLVIAGSDSGGGAGIQADIKTVTALQGFAATAVTALTAQNSLEVSGVIPTPPDFVTLQIATVMSDIGADAVKTGMLANAGIVAAVADALDACAPDVPRVIDPVMVSTSGERLLDDEAADTIKARLFPGAALITPNAVEAAMLTGIELGFEAAMHEAATALAAFGPRAVLIKGGHVEGKTVIDLLFEGGELTGRFESERIKSRNTHGTGCSLASAIACGLAQGMELKTAVGRARSYVIEAIRTAPGHGAGHGPLNHAHTVKPFTG
jgi:hydroxymethylpyrimidine/phosphomethylpyrimidine kinase